MRINNGQFHAYTMLPCAAAGYLHIATEADVKVLIYLLSMEDGTEVEEKALAFLGISRQQMQASAQFWIDKNILPKDILGTAPRVKREAAPRDITAMPTYDLVNISIEMENNAKLKALILEGESILSRTLTTADISTIFGFYDWLKMPPEVIVLLMNFCVMQNKKSVKYMEKMAIEWDKQGIHTVEAAQAYIADVRRKGEFTYRLRGLLQLTDRELTPAEKNFARQWEDMGFSDEMLLLAYEKTVANTGKVAFPYMNKILSTWKEKGYASVEQVQGETRTAPRTAGTTGGAPGTSRFDFDEFERRSFEIIRQQNGGEG